MGLYCGFDLVDDFGYTEATDEYGIVPDYGPGNQAFVETFLEVSQNYVPVDTGYLKSTLSAKAGHTFCECWTNCEYAQYQEYGTWCMPAQPYFEIAIEAALEDAEPLWNEAEEEAWLEEEALIEAEEEEEMEASRDGGGRGVNTGINFSSPSAFFGSLLAMALVAVAVVTLQAMFGADFSSSSRGHRGSGGGGGSVFMPDVEIT